MQKGVPVGLDTQALYRAVDTARIARGASWRDVGRESRVSVSSLSRMGRGHRLSIANTVRVLQWARLDVTPFLGGLPTQALDSREARASQYAKTVALVLRVLKADPNLTIAQAEVMAETVRVLYQHLTGVEVI